MHPARIIGWGSALPDRVVTNHELSETLDTNDEWIVRRTGISERRVGGTTTGLAVEAGLAAISRAGIEPSSIDAVIVATCTPDQTMPAIAVNVIQALGCGTAAGFDLNAACAGFGYALVSAFSMINPDFGMSRVMVIGSDRMSQITDPEDRSTAILFADGAGAVIVDAHPGPGTLLGADLGTDSGHLDLLTCATGGFMLMDGQSVFTQAVASTVESCGRSLSRAQVTIDDISLMVPHQANIRILRTAGHALGIPEERVAIVLDRTGNTSAGSIPIALCDAVDDGRVKPGDLLLVCSFGAGMSWASAVVRWDADTVT